MADEEPAEAVPLVGGGAEGGGAITRSSSVARAFDAPPQGEDEAKEPLVAPAAAAPGSPRPVGRSGYSSEEEEELAETQREERRREETEALRSAAAEEEKARRRAEVEAEARAAAAAAGPLTMRGDGEHVIDVAEGGTARGEGGGDDGDSDGFDPAFDILRPRRVRRVSRRKQLQRERQRFEHLVPIVEDLDTRYVRRVEDEGIFKAPRPHVPSWNTERYVARLVREDLRRELYFDPDGHVIMEPDPVLRGSMRPSTRGDVKVERRDLALSVRTPVLHTGQDEWFEFDLRIDDVRFKDHPLFTREDYLCVQLCDLYDEYKRREAVNLGRYYTEKIRAFRREADVLRQALREAEGAAVHGEARSRTGGAARGDRRQAREARHLASRLAERLAQTIEHTVEARLLKDEEEAEVRQNFRRLYRSWTLVRRWREERTEQMRRAGWALRPEDTGAVQAPPQHAGDADGAPAPAPPRPAVYVGHPVRLKVRQLKASKSKEERIRDRHENHEVEERRELFELRRRYGIAGPAALGGAEAAAAAAEADGNPELYDDEDEAAAAADAAAAAAADAAQESSRRLAVFDERATRSLIRKRVRRAQRAPGDPIYVPHLDRSAPVTPAEKCDPAEQRRRAGVERFRVVCTVLVNGKQVTTTEPAAVAFPSFVARFNCRASLRLLSVPHSIRCRVSAVRFGANHRLAELFLPVPRFGSAPAVQRHEFSGARFEATDGMHEVQERRYFGEASVLAAWAAVADRAEAAGALQAGEFAPGTARGGPLAGGLGGGAGAGVEGRHLIRLNQERREDLDPNDPRNAALIELLRRARLADARGRVFRVSRFQRELLLVDTAHWVQSARRRVLRARHGGALPAGEAVPSRDDDIAPEQFEYVGIRLTDDDPRETGGAADAAAGGLGLGGDDGGGGGGDGGGRQADPERARFQERWRTRQKLNAHRRTVLSVSEVVSEPYLPSFSFNLGFLGRLFAPRRPLRVDREAVKPTASTHACDLVLQVVRAQNVPLRKGQRRVRVFCEVEFQGQRRRTGIGRGANPLWNELIKMPFRSPGGYTPLELQRVSDRLEIVLFDESTVSYRSDYRLRHTRTERTERRYLGTVSVPFSTIYTNGQIDGLFRVEVPLVTLGYERAHPTMPTVLQLYLTLDPVLSTPPRALDFEEWRRRSPVFERCVAWKEEVLSLSQCRKRAVKTLASDINGQARVVCRFVTPQEPPPGMGAREFPRFVSVVPFTDDVQLSQGDVWCTSQEFLTLRAGDSEEHALLLCNYFKWEERGGAGGWSTYVLVGTAVPEGRTSLVLRLHQQDGIIDQEVVWDPVHGVAYNLRTEYDSCPLTSVGCVFDETNVWANIQKEEAPWRLSFYLGNEKAWAPLFSGAAAGAVTGVESLQTPVRYWSLPDDHYIERAARIERVIERRFERWRRAPTRWNYGVSQVLRDNLRQFEYVRQGRADGVGADDTKDLAKLRQVFKGMYGFPLNFRDAGEEANVEASDKNPIVRGCFATRIHEIEDKNAVFALAVTIHPYPCGLGSVWVYLAMCVDESLHDVA